MFALGIRFSVRLVSGYAHVFILLSVVLSLCPSFAVSYIDKCKN